MADIWTAEHVVTDDLAVKIIEDQFPELAPIDAEILGEGFDNTVFLVNKKYVFRFPRRSVAVELLTAENSILPILSKMKLPLAIPDPLFLGKPSSKYPWPFTGFQLVEGSAPELISEEKRQLAAKPLAQFLQTLHNLPLSLAENAGLSYKTYRVDMERRIPQTLENAKKLEAHGLLNNKKIFSIIESASELKTDDIKCLIHGDLHIRNVLVNKEDMLSGVIDWGDVHIGHPAVDLSFAYSYLPSKAREEFFKYYGTVTENTKRLSRFVSIYISMTLLLYGRDKQDELLVKAAQHSLHLAIN